MTLSIESLRKKFVFVPIDKASNKVAIIYKRYYVEVILNEIDLTGHGDYIYCKSDKSSDNIVDKNTEYTKRLCFEITEKEKRNHVLDSYNA